MYPSDPLIEVNNLTKIYSNDEMDTHALAGIDLTIHSKELVAITGPSGCGKSTLLSILGLLDVASSGTFKLNGTDALSLDGNQRAFIRNNQIGFIFQAFNLISGLSVQENVALPLTYQKGMKRKDIEERTNTVLEKVDMHSRRRHYPSQLSGGQQQRVAVARALITNPSIVLADEPIGNLDSKNAERVLALLDALNQDGSTICIVTHDPRSAGVAKRHIQLFDGTIVDDQQDTNLKFHLK